MRVENQLRIVATIIEEYDYSLPLHRFLVCYFKKNKQMGSRDRRVFSDLIYSFFRLGGAFANCSVEEHLLISQFLCHNSHSELLSQLQPVFNQMIEKPLDEKISYLKNIYPSFDILQIASYTQWFSPQITDKEQFLYSLLRQPKLFIRVKKCCLSKLLSILEENNISYEKISDTCLAFKNTTKLEHLQEGERLFEIQDWASQQTSNYFNPQKGEQWWDACAASGGKSLMLLDKEHDINLLVSDIRSSILKNLKERFELNKIKKYTSKQLDLTKDLKPYLGDKQFDGIILDAPCSGSGTWGRTPEMLTQCSIEKIETFSNLQKEIVSNVVLYLKVGKPLIYITCSVFKLENEDVIDYICNNFGFACVKQEIIKGYDKGADSMFIAYMLKL